MPTDRKSVLITGSGHGIGRATARHLAARGWAVAINDLKPEFVEEAVAEITASGGIAIPVVQNVATAEGIEAAVAAVVARARSWSGAPLTYIRTTSRPVSSGMRWNVAMS